MSNPTNHWKLGLFVVVGFCTAMATVVFLSARSLRKETVQYRTYFDESVQGLETGSPVKFRGVTIGNVAMVGVAPDHRHVEVVCDLAVKQLDALRLSVAQHEGKHTKLALPPELRVQLESTGLTGVKFILVDYFDPKDDPLPVLPFPTPENYIPSTPSLMKNLEASVVHAADRFPDLANQLVKVLERVTSILDEIEHRKLFANAATTLTSMDQVLVDARKAINGLDAPKLSAQAQMTLISLNLAVSSINAMVVKLNGDKGLLASAQRTSDSLGYIAQNANHVGPALEETLREVQSAAESIRRLADSIDRDPDMLLKGRAKRRVQ